MNNKSTFLLLIAIILLMPGRSLAQSLQDTLEAVDILSPGDITSDARSGYNAGLQLQEIDSRYKNFYNARSLADLLAQQTAVFVKSYGVNSMATLSFRGASAAQSAVLWNGVPILNPALGVADVSLLGAGLFDKVSIQYGGSAALYGSANVGGALLLDNNDAVFRRHHKLSLLLGGGSYGRRDFSLAAGWGNDRWRIALNTFYQSARNNFSFTDNNDSVRNLENAQLKAGGGILSFDYNLSRLPEAKHRLYARLWWQQYDREIPAALFEQNSVKQQRDISLRSLLGWEKQWAKRATTYFKASFNKEQLRYRDGVVSPDNDNTVYQYYQEMGVDLQLRNNTETESWNHSVLVFAPLQYATINGQNLDEQHSQFRPAVAATYRFAALHSRFQVNTMLRQEWVNSNAAPLLPGAGASFALPDLKKGPNTFRLTMTGNIQRTYRIPTLNELYYFPGGNSSLKPEQGWTVDAGYKLDWWRSRNNKAGETKPALYLSHELHGFNRNIKDWIYWLGGAIWTPHNLAAVHSRGLEMDNKLEWKLSRKNKMLLSARYAYILSTATASYIPGDGSLGKQIPYTPRYNGQANLGLELGRFFINYNHTYTGYRFVTIDESQYLEPYQTGNIQSVYSLIIKDYLIRFSLQVQNVWNERYNVVWERPMPGRYLLFSLQFVMGK